MSRLVDDAVLDYFSLLLTEESSEIEKTESSVDAPKCASHHQFTQVRSEKLTSSAINSSPSLESELSVIESSVLSKNQENEKTPLAQKQSKLRIMTSVETKERDPRLDKLALEQLLEPLLKSTNAESVPQVTDTEISKIDTQPKVKSLSESIKPKVEEKTKFKSHTQELRTQKQTLETKSETKISEVPPKVTKDLLETLDDEFQVLFFKVAGLTLAVPLVSLGGIVKLDRLNHIMGRPSWYKGVQTHRDSQLNVVDTCAWVMPDKYDDALAESVNYQYVVLLEDSNWGLTCESLVNSVKIKKSDVNWRSKTGKRPWLAGVVKEQMCGILHVHSLIDLLNSGLGSQDPVG
ncbi:chemotaxis protein CheW [Shewanella sp. D64]|uniref:chemotaxis protein CheW n=1 Tax=unclassified Shewanella TaxID=196818 RepID=UPI0022BA3D74|nr:MULTISPECIES: chemotaxis protein CheW [unclassified Shewanella]MEC4726487.1 chemotaxis protein CheW [Shewanella sp. D64]MEC4737472.1 chemotaxis protein CheW [Shewanella sp. E94]WBJ97284.1 chemotaxis protein CheW [Shewanella sp. MTB7]